MTYQLSEDKLNLFAALKVLNHGRHGNGKGKLRFLLFLIEKVGQQL